MEKWCILPDNVIQELSHEGNVVLYNLARFCACTEAKLLHVLKMRNEVKEGFKKFNDRKFLLI